MTVNRFRLIGKCILRPWEERLLHAVDVPNEIPTTERIGHMVVTFALNAY